MLFIDFWGSLKETCVQRSPCIERSPGHFPRVTVIYRFDCIVQEKGRRQIFICQNVQAAFDINQINKQRPVASRILTQNIQNIIAQQTGKFSSIPMVNHMVLMIKSLHFHITKGIPSNSQEV